MKEFNPEVTLNETLDLPTLKSLPNAFMYEKVVLGLDIYKYSQYPEVQQIYIPVVFEMLYKKTVENIITRESYFFSKYGTNREEFKKKFISTGDGGFQIFDNVLQAIIFTLIFQMNLKRFCSGGNTENIAKNLHKIVDSIDLRFAITMDKLYSYQDNYYGPAIINNARILSQDNLNRLLVDANSIKWLADNINTPENLIDIDKNSLADTKFFKDYNKELNSSLFDVKGGILSVDIQKIGKINAKATSIDIFNVCIKCRMLLVVDHHRYNVYIVTAGNMNSNGINV